MRSFPLLQQILHRANLRVKLFKGMYDVRLNRLTAMSRMAMVGLIHNRCLTIRDGVFDDSAAVTLMSNDADQITYSADLLHQLWSQTLELCIGMYLLASELGWVCIVPLLIVACTWVPFPVPGCARSLTHRSHVPGQQIRYFKHCGPTKSSQYGDPDAHLDHQGHP
jgi:hypothetical protein